MGLCWPAGSGLNDKYLVNECCSGLYVRKREIEGSICIGGPVGSTCG